MKYFKPTEIDKFDTVLSKYDNHLNLSYKAISTRRNYNACLRNFLLFSGKLPDDFTKHELVNQILLLKEKRSFNYGTMKTYIFAIKYYLVHIVDRIDLWEKIPNPKIKTFNFELLTLCEIRKMFESCKTPQERLVIHLLFETGIRIDELLKLKKSDFDFHNYSVCIRNSKNSRTRVVYFGKIFVNTFNEYVNFTKSLFSECASVLEYHRFISFSKRDVRTILRRLATKCGVSKKVNPHAFRHAFAVHYLNFGGTIYQLQRILGHKHLSTTCNYLQHASIAESNKISVLDELIRSRNKVENSLKRA